MLLCASHTTTAQIAGQLPTPQPSLPTPTAPAVIVTNPVISVVVNTTVGLPAGVQRPRAAIYYGASAPLQPPQDDGKFALVALQPGESISVVLAALIPAGTASVAVQATDGGSVSGSMIPAGFTSAIATPEIPPASSLTPQSAAVGFGFAAPQRHGSYRVFVWAPGGPYEFSFLVIDSAHPLPPGSHLLKAF